MTEILISTESVELVDLEQRVWPLTLSSQMKILMKKMDKVKRLTNKFSSKSKKDSKSKSSNFQLNSIHLCICDSLCSHNVFYRFLQKKLYFFH